MRRTRFGRIGVLGLVSCGLIAGGVEAAHGQCQANEGALLMASDWARYHHLGRSVSISGDTAVAGAHPDASEYAAPGWAYVYERNHGGPGNWGEVAILTASDGANGDKFGWSVSIGGDTIVVGAYEDDDAGGASGSAYVFERNQGGPENWGQVAKLTASDAEGNDNFGYAVAISGDVIVCGARNEGTSSPNVRAGAAYVFERNQGGPDNWGQVAKFKAFNPVHNEKFGAAVAVSADTIVIGDYNTPGYQAIGAAYVFEKPPGGWVNATQTAKLTASDGVGNDSFGQSVSIDGDVALIGAPQDDDAGENSGSAYMFEKPPGGWVNMTETAKLTASGAVADEHFGRSVSINGDVALIGLPQHWSAGIGAGCVFLFDGSSWVEHGRLLPSDGETLDGYAQSVFISGDQAVIAALNWDYHPGGVSGRVVGAMYVFDYLSDCNDNGILDICDIAGGTLHDDDNNGIPDECELLLGDLNCDGTLDAFDIDAFVLALTDPAGYEQQYPDCDINLADINGDGTIDAFDIDPFVELLVGG